MPDAVPIRRDVQPAAQPTRKVAQPVERGATSGAAYPWKRLTGDGRPALRVGALAAAVFVTACFLVFLVGKAKVDERLPLPQTVSASNNTRPPLTVPRESRTDDSSSESAETGDGKPPGQSAPTVPNPLPSVQKATPRGPKLAGRGPAAAREVVDDSLRGKTVRRSQRQERATSHKAAVEPLQVRTVPPEVPVIQPELSSSLQLQNEAVSGPDSPDGTPTAALPAPVKRVRVGSQAQAAKLVFQPKPEYPALARSAHVQGTVRLEVVVAKDGTVEKLRVLAGHPLLVEAAEAAVERWRYQPTVLNSSPIEVVTEVDVDFAF